MAARLWFLALANAIAAAPSIVLPVNSQVPPVARVGKPFSFIFSESTFASTTPAMRFSLSDSPAWLQLDDSSRTLFGTPGSEDIGPVSLNLVATDVTGPTSMPVTLVVSNETGPGLGVSVSDQLPAYGAFSSPSSLLISHSSPLYLLFSRSTFTNTNKDTAYYALCANNTPLPSWINFDSSTLSFSGTTPQLTSPVELSQTYDIHLTASEVVGFSGAVVSFQMVVESHIFSFGGDAQIVNATQGTSFNFSGLLADLTLDGNPAKPSDLTHVAASIPEWMSLDENALGLFGTPPVSAMSQNITVTATDIYGDVAITVVLVMLSETDPKSFFRGSLGTLNATIGEDFDYQIDQALFTSADVVVSVDLGKAGTWLTFDSADMRLNGSLPSSVQPQQFLANITAREGSQSQSQTFIIAVNARDIDSSQSTSTWTQSAATGSPPRSDHTESSHPISLTKGGSKKRLLLAAILIPIAIILGALFLLFLYVRRRKPRGWRDGSQSPSKEKISRPILQESSWVTVPNNEMREQPSPSPSPKRESSKAPKIDLSGFWPSGPNHHRSRVRLSKTSGNPRRDSWRDYVGNFDHLRPEPVAVPEFSVVQGESRRLRANYSDSSSSTGGSSLSFLTESPRGRRYSRYGKAPSGMSFPDASLFSAQQLRGFGRACHGGMGHGVRLGDFAPTSVGPQGFGMIRGSWRNTTARRSQSTTEYDTTNDSSSRHLASKHSGQFSSIMHAFPQTPTFDTMNKIPFRTAPHAAPDPKQNHSPHRATIRIVNSPPPPTLSRVASTLEAFHKHRASTRQTGNPLFSGGPSIRTSSHSLWKRRRHNPSLLADHYQTPHSSPHHHSYSHSSLCISPPISSPRHCHHRRRSSTPLLHRLSRFSRHSMRSLSSSQRFGSSIADDEGDTVGFWDESQRGLQEGMDDDGNRCWRQAEPGAVEGDGGGSGGEGEGMGHPPAITHTINAANATAIIPSIVAAPDPLPRKGEGKVVVGVAGRRPMSVGTKLELAKGASLRGEMGAFL